MKIKIFFALVFAGQVVLTMEIPGVTLLKQAILQKINDEEVDVQKIQDVDQKKKIEELVKKRGFPLYENWSKEEQEAEKLRLQNLHTENGMNLNDCLDNNPHGNIGYSEEPEDYNVVMAWKDHRIMCNIQYHNKTEEYDEKYKVEKLYGRPWPDVQPLPFLIGRGFRKNINDIRREIKFDLATSLLLLKKYKLDENGVLNLSKINEMVNELKTCKSKCWSSQCVTRCEREFDKLCSNWVSANHDRKKYLDIYAKLVSKSKIEE